MEDTITAHQDAAAIYVRPATATVTDGHQRRKAQSVTAEVD